MSTKLGMTILDKKNGHPSAWPELIRLPLPAICENWTSSFIFLTKPKEEKDLQTDSEPAFHPIHLAVEFKELIEQELVNNYADIAKRYGMSRARVTQIMNRLALPSDVQSYLLGLGDKKSIRRLSERRLRKLAGMRSTAIKAKEFWRMAARVSGAEGASTQEANRVPFLCDRIPQVPEPEHWTS